MSVCFFINFSSFKPDTENNANFDAVFSKEGKILIKISMNVKVSMLGSL